jgi:acetyl-CoA carboxylase biotin carboxyl carrier protein
LLKPGLVKAAEELPPNTIKAEEDILSYALFPEVALGYFKWRKEGGPIPADSEATAGSAESVGSALRADRGRLGEAPLPNANSNSNLQLKGTPVLAPLNGTFYRSDAPGKPEMAADGAAVKAGEAVCVVEAMKLFNPIKAPAAGKITFLVEHGKPVTKGQVVASIA